MTDFAAKRMGNLIVNHDYSSEQKYDSLVNALVTSSCSTPLQRKQLENLLKECGFGQQPNTDVSADLAMLTWMNACYADLLAHAGDVLLGKVEANSLVNHRLVGPTSRMVGESTFYAPVFDELSKGFPIRYFVDIGAGVGNVTLRVLQGHPNARALAIDKNGDSLKRAMAEAVEYDIASRLSTKTMDAALLSEQPELITGADTVCTLFCCHDLLAKTGREKFVSWLAAIYGALRPKGRMIVAEAVHADAKSHWFSKVFTLIHRLQKIVLPREDEWVTMFEEAGFMVNMRDGVMPGSRVFTLLKPEMAKAPGEKTPTPLAFKRLEEEPQGRTTRQSQPQLPMVAERPLLTILPPQPITVPVLRAVEGHHAPVPFYFDDSLVPGAPVSIAVVDLGAIPPGGPAEPHRHKHTEYYLLPAYPERVEIEVTIDDHTFNLISPALLPIHAGARHCFRVRKAKPGQFIFGVFVNEQGGQSHEIQ